MKQNKKFRQAARKLISLLFLFWVAITINFLLPRLMPGDGLSMFHADAESMGLSLSEDQVAQLNAFYGFDKPLWQQYLHSIAGIFTGDMGMSIIYKRSVLSVIRGGIVWTVSIVSISTVLSAILGTVLGCASAWKHNRLFDKYLYAFMNAFSEIPSFVIGFLLLYFIAGRWQLLPLSGGRNAFATYQSVGESIKDVIAHAVLPVMTLVITNMTGYYITARQSMLTVLSKDYIGTAKIKGMGKLRILFAHALPNAIAPIIARLFMSFSRILGGAVIIESVFAYPGLGLLLRDAALARDYPMLQGLYVIISGLVILMNFLADMIYAGIDRRVKV